MVLPQLVLIAFYVIIPIFCLYKKRHDLLSSWLTLTCIIDIFNSQKYMNLTAFKLSGLILFPYVVLQYKKLVYRPPVKLLLLYLFYLGILGLVYGHLFPWVDETGLKAGRDIPQWRSTLHFGSMVLEYTATLYLALQFTNIANVLKALNVFMWGAAASTLGAAIEYITQFDIYHFFTVSNTKYIEGRTKGLNYEPRGFAQTLAYGAVVSLGTSLFKNKKYILLFLIFLISQFTLTMSTAGIIVLLVGLFSFFGYFFLFTRFNLKSIIAPALSIIVISSGLALYKKDNLLAHLKDRPYLYERKSVIEKFEVLDAAALNFLAKNPIHLIFGTGPGLITIPTGKKYLVREDVLQWPNGLVALPHMGGVLQLSNGGLLGVILWLLPIFMMTKRALASLRKGHDKQYIFPIVLSLTILTMYVFQLRYTYYFGYALLLGYYMRTHDNQSKEESLN